MVKSFKGVESQDKREINIKRIRDYMTVNLISLHPDQSITEAMESLIRHRISGAPVVNDRNELVGVLSEGDCLKEIVKGRYSGLPNDTGKVGDHMTREAVTMDPDTGVLDAAQIFLNKRLRRFPVIENGKLIGLLTQSDIIKAVSDL